MGSFPRKAARKSQITNRKFLAGYHCYRARFFKPADNLLSMNAMTQLEFMKGTVGSRICWQGIPPCTPRSDSTLNQHHKERI
jgi:hypothetical protein